MSTDKDETSQCAQILRCLKNGHQLTPITALRWFGCFRLGARIYDLRAAGHKIKATWITSNGKRFKSYYTARYAK